MSADLDMLFRILDGRSYGERPEAKEKGWVNIAPNRSVLDRPEGSIGIFTPADNGDGYWSIVSRGGELWAYDQFGINTISGPGYPFMLGSRDRAMKTVEDFLTHPSVPDDKEVTWIKPANYRLTKINVQRDDRSVIAVNCLDRSHAEAYMHILSTMNPYTNSYE